MKDLLTAHKPSTGFTQPMRLAYYALLASLLVSRGYEADRFSILEPSCNGMEMETECRKAEVVKFYIDALNAGVDLSTFYDVNTCGLAAVSAVAINNVEYIEGTLTAVGTNGAQTINKMAGSVNIAAGGSSVVVTNNLVLLADTIVFPVLMTADATANYIDSCVPANGSFTITLNAAATGAVRIGWHILKIV